MLLQTDFHGVWQVHAYDEVNGNIAISQGKSSMWTTISDLIDAGWKPHLQKGKAGRNQLEELRQQYVTDGRPAAVGIVDPLLADEITGIFLESLVS
jgi:hypothetical protein